MACYARYEHDSGLMFPTAIDAALDSTVLGTGTGFLSTISESAKPSFPERKGDYPHRHSEQPESQTEKILSALEVPGGPSVVLFDLRQDCIRMPSEHRRLFEL
jgi:hypothetical protein